MTDIYTLGVQVDSTDVVRGSDDLDDLAQSAQRAENQVEDLGAQSVKTGDRVNRMRTRMRSASGSVNGLGRNAGQAGIQIQQFVGQVQAGTNATTALSMQAADLGIVLGAPLVGVIVSLGAVLVGTLASALGTARVDTEELYDRILDLSDGFRELTENQKDFVAAELQRDLQDKNYEINQMVEKIESLNRELEAAAEWDDQFTYSGSFTNAQPAIEGNEEKVRELAAALDTAKQEAALLQEQIDTLGTPESTSGGRPDSERESTPWWGGDEAVERQAFEIRMQMFRDQQEAIAAAEEAAVNQRVAYLDYYQERQIAHDMALQEAEQQKLQNSLSAYEQYYQARLDAEIMANEDAVQAREVAEKHKLQISQSFDSLFTDMMDSTSKEIFEIGKIGAATKAAVDAYGAINATLAQGGAFAVPAALAIGAAAFANVTKIMSTQYGQTSGSAANIPAPQQQTEAATTTQEINNTFNISGGDGQSIAQQIQEAVDSGQITFAGGGVSSV